MDKKTPSIPQKAEEFKLPTLQELFSDDIELAGKSEGLNAILNTLPPEKWIKQHPVIRGHRYLPIDKIEYLLKKIFKRYDIAITGQGTAFNGVWVTVRISYFNPATNGMCFVDGIGASQMQTAKGTSPADLNNINHGAISMAFPLAKTLAIKDAAHCIGNIFGANLDRQDTVKWEPDIEILSREEKRKKLLKENGINP